MEGKTSLFDTTVVGAIFVVCFGIVFYLINPIYMEHELRFIWPFFGSAGDLVAKWAVVGVASHVCGAIIQMISICWFKRPFEDEPGRTIRQCLQDRVCFWMDHNDPEPGKGYKICEKGMEHIKTAEPDSIFAWVHYSDPRTELIEWGRRKLHYAYLAENWIISIALGWGFGLFMGMLSVISQSGPDVRRFGMAITALLACAILVVLVGLLTIPERASKKLAILVALGMLVFVPAASMLLLDWYYGFSSHWNYTWMSLIPGTAWLVEVTALAFLAVWRLNKLRQDNKHYDNGMIAMYIAGRLWPKLEKEFFPTSPEKPDP